MTDRESDRDAFESALRLLVYAPVGLACYLKDSAPTFLDLFVSRGRREVDGARRAVEERLGLASPEPPSPPSVPQRFADGLGRVASQAGNVVASVAGPVVHAATGADSPRPAGVPGVGNPATAVRGAAEAVHAAVDLPIPGYDGLSASQVIERLDGLSRSALERVRSYELSHRARRTVLASIDQLTG